MTAFDGNDEIPDYGDLIDTSSWIECVECGAFIDYDGLGHPSDGKKMNAHINIYPSEGLTKAPTGTTHIVWFNR